MVPTKSIPACLDTLVDYFQQLTERAPVSELKRRLDALDITVEDLASFAVFDNTTYRRNLVFESDLAEVLLICWKNGQRSPIHNHAKSTCGFKVLQGYGTETVFDLSPCGQVVATSSTPMPTGYVCASQDSDIHQVSNLQDNAEALITLHIYSPPLREMARYSITGEPVEQYRPTTFEHMDGSGI